MRSKLLIELKPIEMRSNPFKPILKGQQFSVAVHSNEFKTCVKCVQNEFAARSRMKQNVAFCCFTVALRISVQI